MQDFTAVEQLSFLHLEKHRLVEELLSFKQRDLFFPVAGNSSGAFICLFNKICFRKNVNNKVQST